MLTQRTRLAGAAALVLVLSVSVVGNACGKADQTPTSGQPSGSVGSAVAPAGSSGTTDVRTPGTAGAGVSRSTSPQGPGTTATTLAPAVPAFSSWCGRFKARLEGIKNAGIDPRDPSSGDKALQAYKDTYRDLANGVPDEIAADWRKLDAVVQSAKAFGDLAKLGTENPDLQETAARLQAWFVTNCGFNPNDF